MPLFLLPLVSGAFIGAIINNKTEPSPTINAASSASSEIANIAKIALYGGAIFVGYKIFKNVAR